MKTTYLRPREKMTLRDVTLLSDHELLQVLLGSGHKGMPVTMVARKVLKLLRRTQQLPTIETLREIPGIGIAKASLLAAVFELAKRYLVTSPVHDDKVYIDKNTLYCRYYTKSQHLIGTRWFPAALMQIEGESIQQIMTPALTLSAGSLQVYDGHPFHSSVERLAVLSRRQRLLEAAAIFGLSLDYLVIDAASQQEQKL